MIKRSSSLLYRHSSQASGECKELVEVSQSQRCLFCCGGLSVRHF